MNSVDNTILFGCRLVKKQFATYDDRLLSFQSWPLQMKQNKYELARAGFFYTKEGDTVECFACGVRVAQWQSVDIPSVEHEKWKPDCTFLKLTGTGEKPKSSYGFGAFSYIDI